MHRISLHSLWHSPKSIAIWANSCFFILWLFNQIPIFYHFSILIHNGFYHSTQQLHWDFLCTNSFCDTLALDISIQDSIASCVMNLVYTSLGIVLCAGSGGSSSASISWDMMDRLFVGETYKICCIRLRNNLQWLSLNSWRLSREPWVPLELIPCPPLDLVSPYSLWYIWFHCFAPLFWFGIFNMLLNKSDAFISCSKYPFPWGTVPVMAWAWMSCYTGATATSSGVLVRYVVWNHCSHYTSACVALTSLYDTCDALLIFPGSNHPLSVDLTTFFCPSSHGFALYILWV